MPIPSSPRAIFAQNVLAEVLCQLRFPPVLAISSSQPAAFQDLIRARYPLYSKDDTGELPVQVRDMVSRFGIGAQRDLTRHVFSTADSARSIFLTSDFLTVRETAYRKWESFGPEILAAADALQTTYQPAFLTRIGLRYQDVIDRTKIPAIEHLPWDALIRPELLGLLASEPFRKSVHGVTSQIVLQIEDVPGAFVQITHGLGNSPVNSPVYYFDADFFLEGQTELSNVDRILDAFHKAAGNLFRWAITPTLFDALGPELVT